MTLPNPDGGCGVGNRLVAQPQTVSACRDQQPKTPLGMMRRDRSGLPGSAIL